MMLTKKDQNVDGSSIAIQSDGDVSINSGLTAAQMTAIMECVADQIPKYAAIARVIVDERLSDFKDRIVNKFEQDQTTNTYAFQDPDFQYLLQHSQHAYARSGEKNTSDLLIELIAERSKECASQRPSLILNRAVEVATQITQEEISALALIFLIRRVCYQSAKSPETLGASINHFVTPFLSEISIDQAPYLYLESLGCGKISMGQVGIVHALAEAYPEAVAQLRSLEELQTATSPEFARQLVDSGLIRLVGGGHMIIREINDQDAFTAAVNQCGLDNDKAAVAFNATQLQHPTSDQLAATLRPHSPSIDKLIEIWDKSDLKHFELSSTGLAIGYTAVKNRTYLKANINIWIN
jgi:hypothetical protein